MSKVIITTERPKPRILGPDEVHQRTKGELMFEELMHLCVLLGSLFIAVLVCVITESWFGMVLWPIVGFAALVVCSQARYKHLVRKHGKKYIAM